MVVSNTEPIDHGIVQLGPSPEDSKDKQAVKDQAYKLNGQSS